MLKGKLVMIDGVFFCVKSEDVIFTDCPLCEDKSMAVSVIGSHLATDHKMATVKCHANRCSAIVQVSLFDLSK